MPRPRPPAAGIGRKKGVKNKLTTELRVMIERALQDVGGRVYLAEQARENPAAFMSLLGKLIPRDLNVSGEIKHSLIDMVLAAKPAVSAEAERPSIQ